MAQRTITTITDDLDGRADATPVTFALDGTAFAIDLHPGNRARLLGILAPYVSAGRRVGRAAAPGKGAAAPRTADDRRESAAIRRWAEAEGLAVSGRGRIPGDVIAKYRAAQAAGPVARAPKAVKAAKAPKSPTAADRAPGRRGRK